MWWILSVAMTMLTMLFSNVVVDLHFMHEVITEINLEFQRSVWILAYQQLVAFSTSILHLHYRSYRKSNLESVRQSL